MGGKAVALSAICLLGAVQVAAAETYRHGLSYLAPLRYEEGFHHFRWVNPNAPKGGRLRLTNQGTYDSFNHFIHWGRPPIIDPINDRANLNLIYDTLLEEAPDEATAHYGRLARGVAVADDYSWIAFELRGGAYWHDGEPITVDDLIFSFETFKTHGSATIRTSLADVEAIERIGPREVRYRVRAGAVRNPNLPLYIGKLPVLPAHYWRERDPSATTVQPPLGSGPYRIVDFQIGRFIVYERVDDYWGADLPVNRGRYNFDRIRYDYFRDSDVSREAMTAGVVDVRPESEAKAWSTAYRGVPAVEAGLLRRELVEISKPLGMWFPVFWNQRQERFRDPRVREALWLLYDFEWINRVLLFDYYDYAASFFHDSEMSQRGLPGAAELALLEPIRELVPQRVFTEPFRPPPSGDYGPARENLRRALALFAEAGWVLRDGVLVNARTGEPFRIEFVVVSDALVRGLMPYMDVLRRIGIDARARRLEVSNWYYRMRTRNFDAGMTALPMQNIPSITLRNYFSSASADVDFSQNWASLRDPAVDYLIDRVIEASSYDEFLAATRALDRVLLWGFHFVPSMGQPGYRLVWWDRFGIPEHPPLQRFVYHDAWWFEPERSARVDETLASLEQD
ncbi:MAG TPA: extracellular solute-binding protein [Pseudomonadales bacterium]